MPTTTVRFGDVYAENLSTRQWDVEPVYDESHTDYLYTRYVLAFEGIVHISSRSASSEITDEPTDDNQTNANSVAYITVLDSKASNAPALWAEIECILKRPRQRLKVWFGSQLVLDVEPFDPKQSNQNDDGTNKTFDVCNGPKPSNLKILQVISDKVLRVMFTIEVCALTCCEGGSSSGPPAILCNRWGVLESMDNEFFMSKTISGVLRLNGAVKDFAHLHKALVVPPLEYGFRRESFEFRSSPDGLTAEYTVIDKQVDMAAPNPANTMSGTHTESTGDGTSFFSECTVKLTGAPGTDKRMLIQRAIQCIDAKLNFLNASLDSYQIENAAIIDSFGDRNHIEARVLIRRIPQANQQFLAGLAATMGAPFTSANFPPINGQAAGDGGPYDPTANPLPKLWGTNPQGGVRDPAAALVLLKCYVQDPCDLNSEKSIADGQQRSDNLPEPSNADEPRSKTTVTELPPGYITLALNPSKHNQSARKSIYLMCRLTSKYFRDPIRAQMPIARSNSSSAGGGATDPTETTSGDASGGSPTDSGASGGEGAGVSNSEGSSSQPTSRIVKFAGDQWVRVISADMERCGADPEIPPAEDEYQDGAATAYLKDHWVETMPQTIAPDGRSFIRRVIAYYKYALDRPPGNTLKTGTLPILIGADGVSGTFNIDQAANSEVGPA